MLAYKLIQNYYEINGNFDNFVNSQLCNSHKNFKTLTEEQLYKTLGYRNTKEFTSKKVHDLRLALLKEDETTLLQISKMKTKDEVENYMLKNKLLPKDYKTIIKENNKILKMSIEEKIIIEYLMNNDSIFVKIKEKECPLHFLILATKTMTNKNMLSLIDSIIELNPQIIRFEKSEKTPYIYNGIMYTSTIPKKPNDIIKSCLKNAIKMNYGVSAKLITKLVTQPLISFSDVDAYLTILDCAELNSMSYAKLVSKFGIKITDSFKAYEYFRRLPIVNNNRIYVIEKETKTMNDIMTYDKKSFYELYKEK